MIIGHKITKSFEGKIVLEDVSFRVDPGNITALIGINGAGKTTLLKIIAGILNMDEGYLRVNGMEPERVQKDSGEVIGFMSSKYTNLSGSRTVKEAIEMCRKIYHVPDSYYEYDREYAGKSLGIEVLWMKECGALSLGEKSRVEFFYTLLMRPTLWLMDEPTIGVDYETRMKMYEILQHVKSRDRKMIVLIATHNIQEMEILCDKVLVLNEGKLIFSGPLEHLRGKYQTLGVLRFEISQGNVVFQDMPINWYEIDGNRVKVMFYKHYVSAATILKYILETARIQNISVTDVDMESMIKSIFQKEGDQEWRR